MKIYIFSNTEHIPVRVLQIFLNELLPGYYPQNNENKRDKIVQKITFNGKRNACEAEWTKLRKNATRKKK